MGCLCSTESSNKSTEGQGSATLVPKSKVKVKFHEKYRKGKILGKGGYGIVYECTNITTGERYAVKIVLKMGMRRSDEAALRLEIDILGSLNHPHIARQFEFFEEWDKFELVLELSEGGELFDHITKKASYNEDEVREIAIVLFQAVQYIHSNGIAHRDLKPENILLAKADSETDLKLVDFGFAKKVNGYNLSTQCGSPGFGAPEILNGVKYGLPADIWSLGVILFILLSGYPPFHDDKDQKKLFKKIKKGEFHFLPKSNWECVSSEAKDLISRMLTLDVNARITIADAIEHAWFKLEQAELANHDLAVSLNSFKKLIASRKVL